MSSPNETIRKLLLAQLRDDPAAFRSAIEAFIVEEKQKSHHVVARDLERLLNGGGEVHRLQPIRSLFAWEPEIPKDGDRGLPLLRVFEPARDLEDLVLAEGARSTLSRFVAEAERAELLRAHGVRPPTRLLLCGPPGCGKTTAAEAIAHGLRLPLAVVRFDVVISSYLGETAANLRKIFDFIVTRPMVVLFDEFDAIAKQRDDDFEHGELKRVVNAFLQLLDGLRGDAIVVGATNHQGLLDPAVWRRFDEIVRLDLPDVDARQAVLLHTLARLTLSGSPEWPDILRRTSGWSHADVERVGEMAVREAILSGATSLSAASLDRAVARYEARMGVVSGVPTEPALASSNARVSDDAVQQGQREAPALGDASGGAGESGSEEAGRRRGTEGSRARATRPVRPRHRKESGAARSGDEDEGTGSGG